ncbi:MAG TPA: hypothetical protein VIF14_07585 [Alphaproteobacteria bacterium]|jgi:hypothetical protein
MISLRYSQGKVWLNFLCAVIGGLVAVVVIGSLWDNAALIGGIAGIVAVVAMLLPGVIKRAARSEPILTIDRSGLVVNLLGIGAIPWAAVRATQLSGIPWVIGLRLTIEYAGTAPRSGFMDKLNWGIQAKQRGELVKLVIGFIDMTDQSTSEIKQALAGSRTRAA